MFCCVDRYCDSLETVVVGAARAIVQKVCRLARNEDEVREALDRRWKGPEGGVEILAELQSVNEDLYRFEEILEQ